VIEYFVGYQRMLAGGARPFDEAPWRELVRRDVERARDIAASHETRSPSGFLTGSGRRSFHPEGAAPRMLAPDHGLVAPSQSSPCWPCARETRVSSGAIPAHWPR
jgi:hypothetical protein